MKFFTRLIVFLILAFVLAVLVPAAYLNRQISPDLIRANLLTLNSVAPDVVQVQMISFEHHLFSTEVKYKVISTHQRASSLFTVTQTIEPGWLPLSRLARFQLKPVAGYSQFLFHADTQEFQSSTPELDVTVFFNKTQIWQGRWDQLTTDDTRLDNFQFSLEGNGIYIRPNVTTVEGFQNAFDVVQNNQQKLMLKLDHLSSKDGRDNLRLDHLALQGESQFQLNNDKVNIDSKTNISLHQMQLNIGGTQITLDKVKNAITQNVIKADPELLSNLPQLLNNPVKALIFLLRTPIKVGVDTEITRLHIQTAHREEYNFYNMRYLIDLNMTEPLTQKLNQNLTVDHYDLLTNSIQKARQFKDLELELGISMTMFQAPIRVTIDHFQVENAKSDTLIKLDNGVLVVDNHQDPIEGQVHVITRQDHVLDDPTLAAMGASGQNEFKIVLAPGTGQVLVNGQPISDTQEALFQAWLKYLFPDLVK